MLSIRLNKSKISQGKHIYYLPEDKPKIYSVSSGIFLIKSISTGKTVSFMMPGDSFYASPKYASLLYLEELKPGVLTQIGLDLLLNYASSKGLLNEVVTCTLELNQPDLIYSLTARSCAREEVNSLAKIYASRPDELKEKMSVNAFIENISFLSRGTISKELQRQKENKSINSVRG